MGSLTGLDGGYKRSRHKGLGEDDVKSKIFSTVAILAMCSIPVAGEWFNVGGVIITPPSGVSHSLTHASVVRAQGANSDIDTGTTPEDVICIGGLHPGILTAAATTIVSDDVDDDVAGTGADTVVVKGLNANWDLISQTVAMDGTNAVTLDSLYIAIYAMNVKSAGSQDENDGTITCKIGGTSSCTICPEKNRSSMAWYAVPRNHTAYLMKMSFMCGKVRDSTLMFEFRVRPFGGVPEMRKRAITANDGGVIIRDSKLAPVFKEKTVIRIVAAETSANDQTGAAGFELLLMENL